MTPLRATRYSNPMHFNGSQSIVTSTTVWGDAPDKSCKKLNPMQMRSDFSRQRPIRLFGFVSDGLKMIFPHATTRPLKAMEAYRVAVMGLHRNPFNYPIKFKHA